jgi:SAM-dependent methyltransferase
MKPYESPVSRARALYRIPTAPQRNRVLELCCARAPLLLDCAWPGESRTVCLLDSTATRHTNKDLCRADYRRALPFAPGSFDLVVLHKTLDDLKFTARQERTDFDVRQFCAQLADLLTPGGVIAGCISNAGSPKRFARSLSTRRGATAANAYAFLTMRACRKLLQTTGFMDVRLFTVLPDWQSPLRLVDSEATVARFAFRYELEARRQRMSALDYFARRLIAELGLYSCLEESAFFLAYKPC